MAEQLVVYVTDSDSDHDLWIFSSSEDEEDIPVKPRPPVKRGRKPIVERFPDLAPRVEQYIKDHSAAAHNRRRDETCYSNGVSLENIRQHVLKTIPGLESISKTTVHRLMKPAREGTRNAKRHCGAVNARVPPKRNNAAEHHPDLRYTRAAVNYAMELSSLFEDECVMMSCDDKNKVNVGSLCVSRYFQINKYFSCDDQPNYPDHDFPHPDSKLIPSGYMRLQPRKRTRSLTRRPVDVLTTRRSRSASPTSRIPCDTNVDDTGRRHITWPRDGPININLQAGKFHSSTSQSHSSHLYSILRPIVTDKVTPRSVVSLLVDGGPDWSTKSLVNLINYGRLWRDLQLDCLVLTAFAPRHSRYNPIERAWAPLSRWLTGVTLPRTLDGEDQPPEKQPGLTEEEVKAKEAKVFDQAIDICAKYWDGKRINGFPVTVSKTPCVPEPKPDHHCDHDILKELNTASLRRLRNETGLKTVREELKFLTSHCVRRTYQMEFFRCDNSTCDHCALFPIRAPRFLEAVKLFGGRLPPPVLDPSRGKGEHMTLLRLLENPRYAAVNLDNGLSEKCTACDKGCQYLFASATDRKRHDRLVHSM